MGRKVREHDEDGEGLKEVGGGICEGGLMEAGVKEGWNGVQTDWPDVSKISAEGNADCAKGFSSASFEGQIGKGIGEPVILLFPNNTPSPFPLDDMPTSSSAPPVAKIAHDPPNDPEIPLCEPGIEPNGMHKPVRYVKALKDSRTRIREGHRTVQGGRIPIAECSKSGNGIAANVDDAQMADLEGKKALDCVIVVNLIDGEALTSELRGHRVLEPGEVGTRHHVCCHGWKDTIKVEFVTLEATGTGDCGNAPGEVELRGSPWDIQCERRYLGRYRA